MIVACYVGEQGFTTFVKQLHQFGVLGYAELLAWLELHRSVLQLVEPPLDQGQGIAEEAFSELQRELEG